MCGCHVQEQMYLACSQGVYCKTVFCFSPGDVTLCADDRHLACFDDSSEEEVGSWWAFLYVVWPKQTCVWTLIAVLCVVSGAWYSDCVHSWCSNFHLEIVFRAHLWSSLSVLWSDVCTNCPFSHNLSSACSVLKPSDCSVVCMSVLREARILALVKSMRVH